MNKLLCVCVLLVVTLAVTSAWTYRSLDEKRAYRKELAHKYTSHAKRLWQLVKRSGIEDDIDCELVAPCFKSLGTDIENVYKKQGSEAQCSSIVDTMCTCVEGKLKDGSMCKSCNHDAQVSVVVGIQGMDSFKGLVCAGLMKGTELKDCNNKILDCVEVCLAEEDDPDITQCVQCLNGLAPTMASTNKCPMLQFLKETKLTSDLIGTLYQAFDDGCLEKEMNTCKPVYKSVDCSSVTSVENVQAKVINCMKNLAANNKKCRALTDISDMFTKRKDLMDRLAQKQCRAEKMVGTYCSARKNRLRELLRSFLQEKLTGSSSESEER